MAREKSPTILVVEDEPMLREAAGARETLTQPVELAELLTTVARHCPRSELTSVGPELQHALDRLSAVADALQAELARLEAHCATRV